VANGTNPNAFQPIHPHPTLKTNISFTRGIQQAAYFVAERERERERYPHCTHPRSGVSTHPPSLSLSE